MVASITEPKAKVGPIAPYRTLDMWRGIAALWVVGGHSCSAVMGREPVVTSNPLFILFLFGQLGVMIFFVVSGYCITASAMSASDRPRPLSAFFRARLRRIYPPYLASTLIIALITVLAAKLAAHHLLPPSHHLVPVVGRSWKFYFASLTLSQVPLHIEPVNVVYWSLCYEIMFYGIIGLALPLIKWRSRNTFFLCLNVVIVGSLIWLILSQATCPFPLNLWFQFGLGAMVYQIIAAPRERANKIFLAVTLVLSIVFAIHYIGPHNINRPSSRTETLFCAAFALVALWMWRFDDVVMRSRLVKALAWVGSISYSLYLTHMILRPILVRIGERLHFTGGRYWLSFLLQIAMDIGFAYIFHLAIEKRFMSSQAKARENQIRVAGTSS